MAAQSRSPGSAGAALGNPDIGDRQRGLLELIYKLKYANLDYDKYPRIVAVGDQNAGKSSLLEALTGTRFPSAMEACTSFVTEIRFRPGPKPKFSIQIKPDTEIRSAQEQEELKAFGTKETESMSFQDIMARAIDKLALKDVLGRFASKDTLVVEKQGPDMPFLCVVDLPGLVKIVNSQQSEDDLKAINDITDRYMESSRTIILAVVGANHDYIQAKVLQKARKFDPSGRRTIGVLTKPDMARGSGLEKKFIKLVNNEDKHYRFNLGWYVLLNPGPGQEWPSPKDRQEAEDAFFTTTEWGTLPRAVRGIAALKYQLSVQLMRHIAGYIPKLRREIQQKYERTVAEIELLGTGNNTVDDMRSELVALCANSRDLVVPAVAGTYTNPYMNPNPHKKPFFPIGVDQTGTPAQMLRARARTENEEFAKRMQTNGHKFHFTSASTSSPDDRSPKSKKAQAISKEDYLRDVVIPLIRQNHGTEFSGEINQHVVYELFREYSENWSRLAQEHTDRLGVICNEFMYEVIDHIWPLHMHEPLCSEFLGPQMKGIMANAQAEVDTLRQDLQFDIPTLDPEYLERLHKWQAETSKHRQFSHAEEVLQKMLIFYKLSTKTFISNVITQVVERHLLQGLHGIFNPIKVYQMPEELVVAISAEDRATSEKRDRMQAEKRSIKEALDMCNKLIMRKDLRVYGNYEPPNLHDGSDEEEVRPLLVTSEQLHRKAPIPTTTHKAGRSPTSSISVSLQSSPSYGTERMQTTPAAPDIIAKHTDYDSSTASYASDSSPQLASSGTNSDSRVKEHLPISPDNQEKQPTVSDYSTPPQHSPPSPPAPSEWPEKPRHLAENQSYLPSPPESVNNSSSSSSTPHNRPQSFAGSLQNQSSPTQRAELSGYSRHPQYSKSTSSVNAYPTHYDVDGNVKVNMNGAVPPPVPPIPGAFVDSNPQLPTTKKLQRKPLLFSKS